MKYFFVVIVIIFLSGLYIYAENYSVGQTQQYKTISDVPWESLNPGDSVLIYWQPEAYHEKWVICRAGTKDAPIVVRGILNSVGEKPVIDGIDAITRKQLNFWNEDRGVIKIGGANIPKDTLPSYIYIENLDIKSGRPPYNFTGRNGQTPYAQNCASIYVEKGEHIVIRDCILHDSGNGLFAGNLTSDLLVESNYIYDNGIENDGYEHNNYTGVFGIIFQFNHFGPLRANCLGNNLKDRSAGCIIRYNWIEGGNRCLDLVDADIAQFTQDSSYHSTYVYGNILIKNNDQGNSQMIHYGGDGADISKYRKGTLYLYYNTIFSTRSQNNTTLIRLSTDDESCHALNNIIFTTSDGSSLAMLASSGKLILEQNLIKPGWKNMFSSGTGIITNKGNIESVSPGFINQDSLDFRLAAGSPCINAGNEVPAAYLSIYIPVFEYMKHTSYKNRSFTTNDIGAYGYEKPNIVYGNLKNDLPKIYPNPSNNFFTISAPGISDIGIYNTLGSKVYKANEIMNNYVEDYLKYIWQPDLNVESGVYFLIIKYRNEIFKDKIVYVK